MADVCAGRAGAGCPGGAERLSGSGPDPGGGPPEGPSAHGGVGLWKGYGQGQRELGLPHSRFHQLSLGQILEALDKVAQSRVYQALGLEISRSVMRELRFIQDLRNELTITRFRPWRMRSCGILPDGAGMGSITSCTGWAGFRRRFSTAGWSCWNGCPI